MFYNYKGQQIYYQTVGKGQDLVLLHGWKQDVSSWWGLTDLLKNDFKLWLIDLPGFGSSDIPKTPWTITDYADSIASFIKNQKINKPILLGHSLGGNIALKLAYLNPNLISKLVLEDSSGLREKSSYRNFILLTAAKLIKYFIPNIFNLREKLRLNFYQVIGSDYLKAGELKETLQNILSEDLETEVSKIKVVTLVIWGENDSIVPVKFGKKLYQLVPDCRFEMIEGVKHFPHLENPFIFSHYVKDFS